MRRFLPVATTRVVRPEARAVDAHRPNHAVSTLTEDHVLDGLEVLPRLLLRDERRFGA